MRQISQSEKYQIIFAATPPRSGGSMTPSPYVVCIWCLPYKVLSLKRREKHNFTIEKLGKTLSQPGDQGQHPPS